MLIFDQYAVGRLQFRLSGMLFTFSVPTYTGSPPVPNVQLCPSPALHYSFSLEVSGVSTGHGIGGSSAVPDDGDDGDDEDVNEEVNVQAP